MGLRLLVAMLRRPGISFLGSLFLGSANLLFGLEPVVQFRAGLIAPQDVQFVGPALDSFFEGEPFLKGVLLQVRVLPLGSPLALKVS